MKKTKTTKEKGFTLVEIMVSVVIFSFVMLMVASMLLAIIQANTKAQTLKTTLDNLNIALDEMSRTIRTGINYSTVCSTSVGSSLPNCFSFTNQECQQETFAFVDNSSDDNYAVCGAASGCITRTIVTSGGDKQGPIALTGTDVNLTGLSFNIHNLGSQSAQPYVTILVQGKAGSANSPSLESNFNIETSISQRSYNNGTCD